MIREKKISILISTFNKSKFIKKTIESCLKQNYKNYEVIVVDTGSSDGTINILKSYLKLNKIKTKFVSRKYKTGPLNQIYAIITSLKIAKGEIVCLLDGDDIFKRNKLKEVNKFFQKNKKINFVQDYLQDDKISNFNRYFLFIKILPNFFSTSTFSIRKDNLQVFFKKHNPYKFSLLEIDARLFFYSKIFQKDHYLLNKVLTLYTLDSNGISSKFKKFSKEWFQKRKQAHYFLNSFLKTRRYPYKIDFFLSKFVLYLISRL